VKFLYIVQFLGKLNHRRYEKLNIMFDVDKQTER